MPFGPRSLNLGDPFDRSHPLAVGLGAAWIPMRNSGGGQTLFDLLGRHPAPLTGAFAWGAGHPALLPAPAAFTDGTQRVAGTGTLTGPVVFDDTIRASLFALCRPTTGGQGTVWAIRTTGSGGAGLAVEFSGGQAAVARSAGDGGSSATATTTATATVGRWCTLAGTFSSLSTSVLRTAYLDGQGATTTTTAVGAGGTTGDLFGTNSLGFSPAPVGVEIAAVLLYPKRVLSASEVWGLHQEAATGFPTLLRRVSPVSWFVGSGGGGGGVNNAVAWLVA